MLPDGTYDVFVVDAAADGRRRRSASRSRSWPATTRARWSRCGPRASAIDELEALGMPGTLTVTGGEPALVLEH